MLFKVKLIILSLMVGAVLPSVIALQHSRPRQALAEPQNRLSCCMGVSHSYCSV